MKTYRRTIGINHGLRIASMLGQIYLNKIDQDIDFSPLADEFAVRHEDDLLVISPHRYRLRRIKCRMTDTLNQLHRVTNPSAASLKTKTNIRHRNMSKIRPVEYWGSFVDIQAREILVCLNAAETIDQKIQQLTIKITRETGYHLRQALINALSLRAHSYYFDRSYTSEKSFVRNFFLLSCYFHRRLHAMCVRFAQFYSNKYIQSKSVFLFRTMRSALRVLMKKAFANERPSLKLKQRCKYVFFLASLRLVEQNRHLFDLAVMTKRLLPVTKRLKFVNKRQQRQIERMIADVQPLF